jgi:hypothetical protein
METRGAMLPIELIWIACSVNLLIEIHLQPKEGLRL